MKRKAISESITLINNTTGKTFTGKKTDFQKAIKELKIRVGAIGLAVGIGIGGIGVPLISNMANNARNARDSKQAIELAASTDAYLRNIKADPVLQAVISQEQVIGIEELSSAITTYKQLKHKPSRTYSEEQQFMEASRIICESKRLVIDTYTNTIKGKVAEAYGITDPEEIAKIEISDYIHASSSEVEHNPKIVMPDGTVIGKDRFLSFGTEMNSTLANNIISARALLDANGFSENLRVEDLPVDDIIRTFEKAKKFNEEYKVLRNTKGDLKAVEEEELSK